MSSGVKSLIELCCLNVLYSTLQASTFCTASSTDKNQVVLRHSSLNVPLNDSQKALSVGFPFLEKSKLTLLKDAQLSSSLPINSGPLSSRIAVGLMPYCIFNVFPVDAPYTFMIIWPAFAPEQLKNTLLPIPDSCCSNLFYSGSYWSVITTTKYISKGVLAKLYSHTGFSFRHFILINEKLCLYFQ